VCLRNVAFRATQRYNPEYLTLHVEISSEAARTRILVEVSRQVKRSFVRMDKQPEGHRVCVEAYTEFSSLNYLGDFDY
jgi:hypothetical protein